VDSFLKELKVKIDKLESEKANLEWYGVYGPPMAMVCKPLKELKWVLEMLEKLND